MSAQSTIPQTLVAEIKDPNKLKNPIMDFHQFNPLRAELFIRNLKMYKQFISFLHTDMTY